MELHYKALWGSLGTVVGSWVFWFCLRDNFLLILGCLHILGYELLIHKILYFNVCIFICENKKKIEKNLEKTKNKTKRKKKIKKKL